MVVVRVMARRAAVMGSEPSEAMFRGSPAAPARVISTGSRTSRMPWPRLWTHTLVH